MEFCDLCENLTPKEDEQSKNKEPHICKITGERLLHMGYHPSIPTPKTCPKLTVK